MRAHRRARASRALFGLRACSQRKLQYNDAALRAALARRTRRRGRRPSAFAADGVARARKALRAAGRRSPRRSRSGASTTRAIAGQSFELTVAYDASAHAVAANFHARAPRPLRLRRSRRGDRNRRTRASRPRLASVRRLREAKRLRLRRPREPAADAERERAVWIDGTPSERVAVLPRARLPARANRAVRRSSRQYDSTAYVRPAGRSSREDDLLRARTRDGDVIDPIASEVIRNALDLRRRRDGTRRPQRAYSPNIKERLDHSCALFDRSGTADRASRAHSRAPRIACRGDSAACCAPIEREYGGVREGEMWVANDPYITGTHLNDVTLVRPVFRRGRLVGYAANKAHHADVGGAVPGSMPADAAELFAEGLVLPPRAPRRAATASPTRSSPSCAPTRARPTPAAAIFGLRSRATTPASGGCWNSASDTAWRRSRRRRSGHSTTASVECAPRCARSATERLEARDYLEDRDGRPSIAIALRLDLRDGSALFDYTRDVGASGLSAQRRLRRHALGRVLRAARGDRPDDSDERGLLSSGRVLAPEGSLLNPRRPAPVSGGNVETSTRNADVVLQALAKAAPSASRRAAAEP